MILCMLSIQTLPLLDHLDDIQASDKALSNCFAAIPHHVCATHWIQKLWLMCKNSHLSAQRLDASLPLNDSDGI